MKLFVFPVKLGMATSAGLIIYFLILSLLGFHANIFFSLFNVVITSYGIYIAIKLFREQLGMEFNYGKGFIAGMLTGTIVTFVFTFFFALYATEFNTQF